MKLKSYKILFRLFSFLSDKTNGSYVFVRYKLILGSLIIGLNNTACSPKQSAPLQVTCYDMSIPDSTIIEIDTDPIIIESEPTCYMQIPIEIFEENMKIEKEKTDED